MDDGARSGWFRWAEHTLDAGPITDWRGLREGGSPWLVTTAGTASMPARTAVLRIGDGDNPAETELEAAALQIAGKGGIAVPDVIGVRLDGDRPLLLISAVDGSSAMPQTADAHRLRALGTMAAKLHAVPARRNLPIRTRPIETVDFAALRRTSEPDALLRRAEDIVASIAVPAASGFVHGDLWQGNVLWDDGRLAALIDWDCAGIGNAGVDLGSLRCDVALCYGGDAADVVLAGWEAESGRPADDRSYWDVVAALSTPPDLGWFVTAIGDQGRSDLSREVLRERRDEFLEAALLNL